MANTPRYEGVNSSPDGPENRPFKAMLHMSGNGVTQELVRQIELFT